MLAQFQVQMPSTYSLHSFTHWFIHWLMIHWYIDRFLFEVRQFRLCVNQQPSHRCRHPKMRAFAIENAFLQAGHSATTRVSTLAASTSLISRSLIGSSARSIMCVCMYVSMYVCIYVCMCSMHEIASFARWHQLAPSKIDRWWVCFYKDAITRSCCPFECRSDRHAFKWASEYKESQPRRHRWVGWRFVVINNKQASKQRRRRRRSMPTGLRQNNLNLSIEKRLPWANK